MSKAETAAPAAKVTRAQWLMLVALMSGVFLGALDISIVSPAFAEISRDLSVNQRDLPWIVTIYTLVYVVAVPLVSALSDRLGRRAVFLGSVAIFGLGSLTALFAHGLFQLLAARGMQALGGGGLFPVASTVIGETFPKARRGMALGFIGMMWGVAAIVGPLIGGWITQWLGWPWIFSISFGLSFPVFGLAWRVLPKGRAVHSHAFDVVGMVLLGIGMTGVTYGLNRMGRAGGGGPTLMAPDIAPWLWGGVALLVGFFIYERRPPAPIIRTSLFGNGQLDIALALSFARGMTEAGLVFLPYYAMTALGLAPGPAGTLILATALTVFLATEPAGMMVDRVGPRPVLVTGAALTALGSALMTGAASLSAFIGVQVVMGLGLSALSGAPVRYVVLAETGDSDRAAAQALVSLMSSFGIMAGSALAGALLAGGTLDGFKAIYRMVALTALMSLVFALFLKGRPKPAR